MKRYIKTSAVLFLALAMIFSVLPIHVLAAYGPENAQGPDDAPSADAGTEVEEASLQGGPASGVCGTCTWYLSEYDELSIRRSYAGAGKTYSHSAWVSTEEKPGYYGFRDKITKVVIHPGVETIGDGLFYNLDHLEEIYIPVSVRTIGVGAFANCNKLRDVYYAGTEYLWEQVEIDSSPLGDQYSDVNNAPLFYAAMHFGKEREEITLQGVYISGLTEPAQGEEIIADGVIDDSIQAKEWRHSSIYQQGWYTSKSIDKPASGTFEYGNTYFYSALIRPDDNEDSSCRFPGPENGQSGVIGSDTLGAFINYLRADEIYWYGGGIPSLGIEDATGWIRVWISYPMPAKPELKPIKYVFLNVTPPSAGDPVVADGEVDGDEVSGWGPPNYYIYDQGWYTSESTGSPASGSFENGKTYYWSALLKPDPGYVFVGTADGKTGKIGDESVHVSTSYEEWEDIFTVHQTWYNESLIIWYSDLSSQGIPGASGWIRVYVPFRASGPIYNGMVEITDLTMPAAGEAIQSAVTVGNSRLKVVMQQWNASSGETVFRGDAAYLWTCRLALTDGSRFADDEKDVYVNGVRIPQMEMEEYLGMYNKYLNGEPCSGYYIMNDAIAIALIRKTGESMVYFDPEGGSGSMEPVSVPTGSSYELPYCGFTAPEYRMFDRWQTRPDLFASDESYDPYDSVTVSGDMTVRASWKQAVWKVEFKANGGTGSMEPIIMYPSEEEWTRRLKLPSCGFTGPEGKRFIHWQVNARTHKPGDTIEVNEDTYIMPVWGEGTGMWTVTFLPNGGTGNMADVSVTTGTEWKLPLCNFNPPEGKGFKCWEVNGTLCYPGDAVLIDRDTAVRTIWADGSWIVSFDANGGEGAMYPYTVAAGDFKLPQCSFTPPAGAVFVGWDKGAAGDIIKITGNIVLKAIWRGPTVSFDPAGGSGTMESVTVEIGEKYTLPVCGFTPPSGMAFAYWKWFDRRYDFENDTVWAPYDPGYSKYLDGDIFLRPEWVPAKWTISFDANGGSGTMDPLGVVNGINYLPECAFTPPSGKTFDSWDLGAPGTKVKITQDTTLKAIWKDKPVVTRTVKFAANGGSGTMAAVKVNEGDTYTLPSCAFTPPAGKVFDKWDLGKTGATVTITEDTTLKALWKDNFAVTSSAVSGGTKVTVTNSTASAAPLTVIASAYDSYGRLVTTATVSGKPAAGKSLSVTVPYTSKDGVKTIKTFVLDRDTEAPLRGAWAKSIT